MIGLRRSSHYLLILLILAKSKVLYCQEYDADAIDYRQLQVTKRAPRHHHHRHYPKTFSNVDYKNDIKSIDYDNVPTYEFPDEPSDDYQNYDYKMREFLLMENDSWPKFEDIERLAGISEWKKERWKNKLKIVGSTERPPRAQKFTYRRVQGGMSGSKRNAIIAVSAIAPRVRPKE